MHRSRLLTAGFATTAVFAAFVEFAGLSGSSLAQTKPTATNSAAKPPGLQCAQTIMTDPFAGRLAGPVLPDGLLPIDEKLRTKILKSGLPCQESAKPAGFNPPPVEKEGLENLQRGFDFYSWLTFIALNSPADGSPIDNPTPGVPTQWEDMDNFKQLLDVMLPAKMQPPKWPTDRAGMEAERERLMPEECRALHKEMPKRTIVKMIEESFNEPFKTGPLIDQQGHYAIFDILMNRQMFDYIADHELYSKEGQRSAVDLVVDFPPGQNPAAATPAKKAVVGDTGAFMLKVSWKILEPDEIRAKNFHMMDALVLMPPGDPKAKRPCLPETLGLIGFHAVHKTASRPQWIWTSFEHVKNVPDKNEVAASKFDGPYNFFEINCKDDCPEVNATPPRQFWQPDPALKLKFKDDRFKSQIVREIPLTDAARNMNTIFHSMLKGTVWVHYMLLSTQWPSVFGCTILHAQNADAPAPKTDFLKQPDMTCSPAPTYLANSTLETYSQGNIPQASSSCIGCHGNAVGFQPGASDPKRGQVRLNQSDFTFMLEKAQ